MLNNHYDVINQFKDFAFSHGLDLPSDLTTDKLTNLFVNKKKVGAYTLHLDNKPAGYIQNFKTGAKENWTYKGDYQSVPISTKEIHQKKELADKNKAITYKKAAETAKKIWDDSLKDLTPAGHPYLMTKKISPHHTRKNYYYNKYQLIIPIQDNNNDIVSLQFINEDGAKILFKGGKKQGCYSILNPQDNPLIIAIAEGFSTTASIIEDPYSQNNRVMGVMAIDAGNLESVAITLRAKYPLAKFFIFGDINDINNTGEICAKKAALACDGVAIFPPIKSGEKIDFNDYLTSGNVTLSIHDLINQASNTMFNGNVNNNNNHGAFDYTKMNHDVNAPFDDSIPIDFIDNPKSEIIKVKNNNSQSKPEPIKNTFKLISLGELNAREYKTDWLINGFIERGNLGLMFGNSASGKSLIVQDMSFCIAAGISYKGKETKQGNVVYIAGEGFNGLQKRFKALEKHYGCTTNNLYLSEQPAEFMSIASADSVRQAVDAIGNVSLIVIDTFHRNMGNGDENSAKDFAQFLNNLDTFIKPTGAAVLIIHHSGHDTKERSRGSSSIRAAMDVEYQVTKEGDKVIMKNTKMKDHEPPAPMSFMLKNIDTGLINDDGVSITSVILESSGYVSAQTKSLTPRQQDVLTTLYQAIEKHGIEPPPDIKALFPDSPQNIPKKVVHIDQWRTLAYPVIDADTPDSRKKAFQRIRDDLKKIYKTMAYNNYWWII